ncbi:NAD(P)H-dependent oxidoreductase [Mycobacterium haemophilum]|nr:NAD(P)H-dependent oxidoreductase [Mycobacterium haemophilum]
MPENSNINVLVLVGSLRVASINRQMAELAVQVAPDGVTVTVFEGLGELPFYDEDIDTPARVPASVTALRDAVADADAVLVITPEYNGSIPAMIKNAVDWLSRPFGDGAVKNKPLVVIGGSLGQYGGVWAHDEARKSFGIAGANVIDGIRLSVPFQSLAGKAPADSREISGHLRDIVGKLAAEVS